MHASFLLVDAILIAEEHSRSFWIVPVSQHDAIHSNVNYDNVRVTGVILPHLIGVWFFCGVEGEGCKEQNKCYKNFAIRI